MSTEAVSVIEDLLAITPTARSRILEVRIGVSWTAVVADVAGERRCGLAATQPGANFSGLRVRDAGRLTELNSDALCELARSGSPTEVAVGLAAVNALLPRDPSTWVDINAAEVLAERGRDTPVALIGHFPFVNWLRECVPTLWVLELDPQPGDLPASAAPEILSQAGVVAITSMTLLNGTFDGLLALRRPDAQVMLLGPTTPLAPLLFQRGVDLLSGAIVEDIDAVLRGVSQGAGFRQLHRLGVRLVTLTR